MTRGYRTRTPNVTPKRLSFSELEGFEPLTRRIHQLDKSDVINKSYTSNVFGAHFISNEDGQRKTLQTLSTQKAKENSCHIGVSGWFNLDIMATKKTPRGIIIDSNPHNSLLFDHTFKMILSAENRFQFMEMMGKKFNQFEFYNGLSPKVKEHAFRVDLSVITDDAYEKAMTPSEQMRCHANVPQTWLSSDENYNHIRSLVKQNKIAVITGNITDTGVTKTIGRLIRDNNYEVDTLYLSNVHYYINQTDQNKYLESFRHLNTLDTQLIDSDCNLDIAKNNLQQNITSCRQLESEQQLTQRWFDGDRHPSKAKNKKEKPSEQASNAPPSWFNFLFDQCNAAELSSAMLTILGMVLAAKDNAGLKITGAALSTIGLATLGCCLFSRATQKSDDCQDEFPEPAAPNFI